MVDAHTWFVFFLALLVTSEIHFTLSYVDPSDAIVLQTLRAAWKNTPPSWSNSTDPCGAFWVGVTCANGRVTSLRLVNLGLVGNLKDEIGNLTELTSLDLAFNPELTGALTPRLGDLKNLRNLILMGCGFSGSIPDEIGNLAKLIFLDLKSNKLTGSIPPNLGKLSNLYWLSLADNQLTGPLPVSTATAPGLDLLVNTKKFILYKNQLSGSIPSTLFSSNLTLSDLVLYSNKLNGSIPLTLGLVQTLRVLRLDQNALVAEVPSSLNNLVNINELNLADNLLTGRMPNVTQMKSLYYLDLSNNLFEPTEASSWLTTLPSQIIKLVIQSGSLQGPFPPEILLLQEIQSVLLANNSINGSLVISGNISPQLQLVDLQNNKIASFGLPFGEAFKILLAGNPLCNAIPNSSYCQPQQNLTKPYSTSLANCTAITQCHAQEKLSPGNCQCSHPYEGSMNFRAPFFRDLSNATIFRSLETSLWVNLSLSPGSVFLQNPYFNADDYLEMEVALFPASGKCFNQSEIERIGFALSNQSYRPPVPFGPYYFIASPYPFPGNLCQSNI